MHSQGPWRWKANGDLVDAEDKTVIADCGYEGLQIVGEHRKENARLMGSALDLLALLVELTDIEGPLPGNAAWAQKVKIAIATATQS